MAYPEKPAAAVAPGLGSNALMAALREQVDPVFLPRPLLLVPALSVLLQRPRIRPAGIIILSALIGHIAWHWMVERLEALSYVGWPSPDESALGWLLAWLVLLAAVGGAVRLSRKGTPSLSRERGSAPS